MNLRIVTALIASLLFAGIAVGETGPAGAEGDPWRTDYKGALAVAKDEGRIVLLDFTGSDWCVWCHRLDGEVFSKQAFLDYARDSLVLVKLDFPRRTKLPAELQAQNDGLAKQFDVTGYPTIVVVDASGAEIGRLGYIQGGAKTFVRALKKFAVEAAARVEPGS